MLTVYIALYNVSLEFKCTKDLADDIICICPFLSSANFLYRYNKDVLDQDLTEQELYISLSQDNHNKTSLEICNRLLHEDGIQRIIFQRNPHSFNNGIKKYKKLIQDNHDQAARYIEEVARLQAASQLYQQCGLIYEQLYFLQTKNIRVYYRACDNYAKEIEKHVNDSEDIPIEEFCNLLVAYKTYIDFPDILTQILNNEKCICSGLEKKGIKAPIDVFIQNAEDSRDSGDAEYLREKLLTLAQKVNDLLPDEKYHEYKVILSNLNNDEK